MDIVAICGDDYTTNICVHCGCPSPCLILAALHVVTNHIGGCVDIAALGEDKCRLCLLDSLEPYCIRFKEGKYERVALIGKTEALVPY